MNKESSFNKSKDTITLKIEIPKEIYPTIKQRANDQHISLKEYGLLKVTDDVRGAEELRRDIIKQMPIYYNMVKGIPDQRLKDDLIEFGGFLCRL